ncbi:N-methylglutamate synthase subunit A [Filomicrobium insigne]|uniref:N-methylglutamate synthase subunit A n=1 Tax=Filomicrobium insigne TaxID=418854 RepID=A0A1H0J0V1_9HYPH|nr:glutamine amidotransferase family protein [Filomicrobium insigne]SDO37336.1 N-methylglutamate synthase subunit A [Filomicrobium insigne]
MCGIVGLFLKAPRLEPEFGALLANMLETMTDRGPDSAGFAVYGSPQAHAIKLTLRAPVGTDFIAIATSLKDAGLEVREMIPRDTHAVLTVSKNEQSKVVEVLARVAPEVKVVGTGHRMEIYKEVGLPADVARRFSLKEMKGTHGIGHTRMATESAVTTAGAHPFTTGVDQCLVHNGSLSNHCGLRRQLGLKGISFATQNDTEVAAAYISNRLSEGDTLGQALEAGLGDLDGFYTFVVGTESGFGVLRDPIACKPAVMAETDDYVAFGSEYRVLVDLPDIEKAHVWEPKPAHAYFWQRGN